MANDLKVDLENWLWGKLQEGFSIDGIEGKVFETYLGSGEMYAGIEVEDKNTASKERYGVLVEVFQWKSAEEGEAELKQILKRDDAPLFREILIYVCQKMLEFIKNPASFSPEAREELRSDVEWVSLLTFTFARVVDTLKELLLDNEWVGHKSRMDIARAVLRGLRQY